MYTQLALTLDRVVALAPERPGWKDKQPFKGSACRARKVSAARQSK